MDCTFHAVDSVDSTNTLLSRLAAEGAPHATVVYARRQTAGRGQRGNSWEAEPGKNITMSMLFRAPQLPPVPVARQFALSEHVAMAVADAIEPLLPDPSLLAVKWPNDIYVGDRKIGGILIECALSGSTIGSMIVGLGLNVNQTRFVSDAPNPVSLCQLVGKTFDIEELMRTIAGNMLRFPAVEPGEYPFAALHRRYMSRLWRRTGLHGYLDKSDGSTFFASIDGVEPDGHLRLILDSGEVRRYPFRSLSALL